jgi:hypothetical protein
MSVVFDSHGNLPPGVHQFSWSDFAQTFGWNDHRRRLLAGLQLALDDLKTAGCQTVYVDGSFVTAKETPGDFDACWERAGVVIRMLPRALMTFDPGRATQKARYGGELFPADALAEPRGRRFREFFQVDKRSGQPKGIVVLDLRRFP